MIRIRHVICFTGGILSISCLIVLALACTAALLGNIKATPSPSSYVYISVMEGRNEDNSCHRTGICGCHHNSLKLVSSVACSLLFCNTVGIWIDTLVKVDEDIYVFSIKKNPSASLSQLSDILSILYLGISSFLPL